MSHSSFPVGKYAIPAVVLAGFLYMFFKVHDILLPFVLGATLAFLLSPLVRFFEVRGLKREPVVVFIFGGLLALLSAGAYLGANLASQEASKAAQEMPRYIERGQRMARDLQTWAEKPDAGSALNGSFAKHWVRSAGILEHASDDWNKLPNLLLQKTPNIASHVLPFVELFLLVPIIAFLLLLEGPAMLERALRIVPARYVEMVLNIIFEIDNSMGNYVRSSCLKSLAVGLVSLAGFWMIGLDYSIQLAALSALTNVVPVVGPLVTGLAAGAVALFQWGTVGGLLKVVFVCLAIRAIDDGVLQIVMLKDSVELHPILILFSLMAGGALWGIWGLLFGVPLACMFKVLLEVVWEWYRSEYGLRYDDTPAEVSHIPLI